jgi:hypothetical protein
MCTGAQDTKIWQINSQNIIRRRITKECEKMYTHASEQPINRKGIRDSALRGCVNTSGKAGAKILHVPLGDDSSPSGDSAVSR